MDLRVLDGLANKDLGLLDQTLGAGICLRIRRQARHQLTLQSGESRLPRAARRAGAHHLLEHAVHALDEGAGRPTQLRDQRIEQALVPLFGEPVGQTCDRLPHGVEDLGAAHRKRLVGGDMWCRAGLGRWHLGRHRHATRVRVAATAATEDELGREDVHIVHLLAAKTPQENLHCKHPLLTERLADRGQWRGAVACLAYVVETDHRHFPWHSDVVRSERVNGPERDLVAAGDYGVGDDATFVEQDAHRLDAAAVSELPAHDEGFRRLEPMFGQHLTVQAQTGTSLHVLFRAGDASDPVVLVVFHEMPDTLAQGLLAVDEDAGHPLERGGNAAHRPRPESLAITGEIVQPEVVADGPGHDHESVDAVRAGEVVDDVLPLAEAEGRAQHAAGEDDEIDA